MTRSKLLHLKSHHMGRGRWEISKKSKMKLDTIVNKKINICTMCYWNRRGLEIGDQEFSQNKEKSLDENLL